MSSPAATTAGTDVLPALPPIRTTAPPPLAEPARSSPASPSTATDAESLPPPAKEAGDEEVAAEEPTTPTSEESKLRPPTECPPAPRKPKFTAPAKRKFPSSSAPSSRRTFFPVARDLSTVFRSLPPKKRIRAG
ncbi:hypothetical protein ACP70R_017815 [Stipagrostis hirtigluma subsp. patula]